MNYKNTLPSLTKRIDLNMGYACNLNCRFCYYIKSVDSKSKKVNLSTKECKRLIKFHHKCGMEILEFTGGEPTIREDLFELVNYAREEVGFTYISIITNGVRLADINYSRALVRKGVKDFLFSIHGSSAKLHDYMTGISGSYKFLIKAIENLLSIGVRVRCNSVVTEENLEDLYARAELLCKLGVKTVNFIVCNPLEQAKGYKGLASYLKVSSYFKKIADNMYDKFDKLTFRYIPLCVMRGYERYVQNVHQVHYDHDEWNYYQRAYIREPYWKWKAGVLFGLFLLPGKLKWMRWGWEHAKHASILESHSWLSKVKLSECNKCKYKFICGGIWRKYNRKFSSDGIRSIPGPLILKPWYFMDAKQRVENIKR